MEYGRESVVQVIGTENWSGDQAIWATEDDYRAWNNNSDTSGDTFSNSNYEQRQSQSRSGSLTTQQEIKNSRCNFIK
uniref:Uncharacterized protein n=1 Tax=Cannabis sativa TaxID=3483 RepID=A0A803R617_CANSA